MKSNDKNGKTKHYSTFRDRLPLLLAFDVTMKWLTPSLGRNERLAEKRAKSLCDAMADFLIELGYTIAPTDRENVTRWHIEATRAAWRCGRLGNCVLSLEELTLPELETLYALRGYVAFEREIAKRKAEAATVGPELPFEPAKDDTPQPGYADVMAMLEKMGDRLYVLEAKAQGGGPDE